MVDYYPGTLATGRLNTGQVVQIEDTPFNEMNVTTKTVIVRFKIKDVWHRLQVLLCDITAAKPRTWTSAQQPEWGRTLTSSTIVSTVKSET